MLNLSLYHIDLHRYNDNDTKIHWTGDYAEKAERLFTFEKAINISYNSIQAYINNNNNNITSAK